MTYKDQKDFLDRHLEMGTFTKEEYNEKLKKAKQIFKVEKSDDESDNQKERRAEMKPENENKNKMEKSEKEYLDLIIELMQMVFRGKLKGFEVKNAASGKIRIVLRQ